MNFKNKLVTSATLIDLSKAFHYISHDLILKQLYLYGDKGIELGLLFFYLNKREKWVFRA